jgi:transposase
MPALGLAAAQTAMETIEITLPDGVVLRVGAGVDQAALSRVLAVLRGG